ncbi:MAG: hypothetical protein N2Z22_09435 [Turneriella sp.]|nr:hypothetical protein [Turneriella sp.]
MRWGSLCWLLCLGLGLGAEEFRQPVLQYVDGHGNSYEFTPDGDAYTLEFIPVKKGNYSGGEHAIRRVSRQNFDKVLSRIDAALRKKLAKSRERGTALILKEVKGEIKEYILPKGSPDIAEIEALLYTLF